MPHDNHAMDTYMKANRAWLHLRIQLLHLAGRLSHSPDGRVNHRPTATVGDLVPFLLAFARTGFGGSLVTTDHGRALLVKIALVDAARLVALPPPV